MHCARCEEPFEQVQAGDCPHCGADPLLDGRYRLEAVVGHGAVGTTWRATIVAGEDAGATVAIKELPLRHVDGAKARELVHREAAVLRQLHHPAIPAYRGDLVVGRGRFRTLYIVQEHIDGQTLADEMKDRRYSQSDVLEVVHELLGILGYLHGLAPPVVHRDLKPGNIMRRKDGRLALIDFGAVRDVVKGDLGGSTVAGTFGYMAPEQFQGDAVPATDLFGLGALAVAMLTRREPQSMMDYAGRIQWREYAMVTPAVASLLDDLLAPDLARRLPNVPAALERVELALAALRRPADPWVAHVPPPSSLPSDSSGDGVEVALARVRETRWALRPPPALPAVHIPPRTWHALFPEAGTTALIERGRLERVAEIAAAGLPSPWRLAVAASVALGLTATGGALLLVAVGLTAVAWGEEQPPPLSMTASSGPASSKLAGIEPAAFQDELARDFLRDPEIRGCIMGWEQRLSESTEGGGASLQVFTRWDTHGTRVDYVLPDGLPERTRLETCLARADDAFAQRHTMGASRYFQIPLGY